jgi:hypothetical protein
MVSDETEFHALTAVALRYVRIRSYTPIIEASMLKHRDFDILLNA